MTAIHETAYPRVRSNLTEQELRDLYTPTTAAAAFVARTTQSPVAAFGCMVLVKGFGKEVCEISGYRWVVQELSKSPNCWYFDFALIFA